jgi:hypothetical protein
MGNAIASQRVGAKRRPMTGSAKQSIGHEKIKSGLLRRGACHRARIRATRWLLAMTVPRRYRESSRIIAAPFSAIIAVGVLVFPEVIVGITEASATRSPAIP